MSTQTQGSAPRLPRWKRQRIAKRLDKIDTRLVEIEQLPDDTPDADAEETAGDWITGARMDIQTAIDRLLSN